MRLAAVWLVFFVLLGAILMSEHTRLVGSLPRDDRADPRLLLPVPLAELGAVEVAHAGVIHRFERDATGAWFYHGVHAASDRGHTHAADPAMAARIERAFAALGRARIEREFALTPNEDYGVTRPQTLILVYRPNAREPLVQYAIGDVAPDTVSRYVLAVGSSVVATIPEYQIDNVLALIRAVGSRPHRPRAAPRAPAGRTAAEDR